MGFSVDIKFLKQCKKVMTVEQQKKLAEAIQEGGSKTDKFTRQEFKDLVNRMVDLKTTNKFNRNNKEDNT